jgi:hypothetical protein
MGVVEITVAPLALEEHDRLAVAEDGVVDLLSSLGSNVGHELRGDLSGIEDVVPESIDERHDESALAGLLGADVLKLARDPGREVADLVVKITHTEVSLHLGTPARAVLV